MTINAAAPNTQCVVITVRNYSNPLTLRGRVTGEREGEREREREREREKEQREGQKSLR